MSAQGHECGSRARSSNFGNGSISAARMPMIGWLLLALLGRSDQARTCPLIVAKQSCTSGTRNDANDRAPQGRELSVREVLTRIIVDWSGSWQAARPGNWLGRSPATKAALGC